MLGTVFILNLFIKSFIIFIIRFNRSANAGSRYEMKKHLNASPFDIFLYNRDSLLCKNRKIRFH